MKKYSHPKQIDRHHRSFTIRKPHMVLIDNSVSHIPESIVEAYDRVQSLVERSADVSLEELQGAVEYLLDKVRAAGGQNGEPPVLDLKNDG